MIVVVAHMLSQLLNTTFAMNFIVGTDNGLFTRGNVCTLPEAPGDRNVGYRLLDGSL